MTFSEMFLVLRAATFTDCFLAQTRSAKFKLIKGFLLTMTSTCGARLMYWVRCYSSVFTVLGNISYSLSRMY